MTTTTNALRLADARSRAAEAHNNDERYYAYMSARTALIIDAVTDLYEAPATTRDSLIRRAIAVTAVT